MKAKMEKCKGKVVKVDIPTNKQTGEQLISLFDRIAHAYPNADAQIMCCLNNTFAGLPTK